MRKHPDGPYVAYEDYVKLYNECEELESTLRAQDDCTGFNPIPQCATDSPEWAFRAVEMINDLAKRVHRLEAELDDLRDDFYVLQNERGNQL